MATRNSTRIIAGGLLALTIVTTGCATASQRFVSFPAQGQDAAKQAHDIQECELIAQGKKDDPLMSAAVGGLGRGLVAGAASAAGGAILGSLFGRAGQGAQAGLVGLGVGAILGVVEGLAENQRRYNEIYRACLAARGYTTGG
jgi:hypothetical protein